MLAAQGADTVIYERLDLQHPVNKQLREVTRAHMEEFGAGGLRTLCLSYAELDHEEYDRWDAGAGCLCHMGHAEQHPKSLSMHDCAFHLLAFVRQMESQMHIPKRVTAALQNYQVQGPLHGAFCVPRWLPSLLFWLLLHLRSKVSGQED